jgi:RNA polymerase sigma factor (TIGR02999 family)
MSQWTMTEGALASDLTEQLRRWSERPDLEPDGALFSVVYEELHAQAHRFLGRERPEHTLQTTALVNEAYLRLVDQNVAWKNRAQFFAVAATLMRRILVDYAKQRQRLKRGGNANNLPLDDALEVAVSNTSFDLLALDQALNRLAEKEEYLARVVELRFFSGLDVPETAKVLGVSESTVKRDWAIARAWLHRELTS